MDTIKVIEAVIKELKDLFKDGGELKGYRDWNRLVSCVLLLEDCVDRTNKEDEEPEVIEEATEDA